MIRPSVLPLALALAFSALLTPVASALQIKDVRWGFDGKVVLGKFNILSVLVDEPGPGPFDGDISLSELRGSEATVGAPQVQKVYVTPGTQRWVQFAPFIASKDKWKLRWGKSASYEIDEPTDDAPATVLLLDPNSAFVARAQLKAFPEDLFPTSVVATDGLDQLVIDHVPRWDAPRREAFLDWLRRGGVVHLLRGPDGHPVFEGDLAVLNTSSAKERLGAGTIARHDITRAECNDNFLRDAEFPLRGKVKEENEYDVIYGIHSSLLQRLAGMTKPDVQWWLLYLLTIAYLVVIGPVHYRWSRKVDYRVAIGGFLGTVAAFSLAFIFAGSRGAGEIQTAHTLAIAQSIGDKRWDVMQWVSAFATTGDKYRLTHAAPWNLYAAPSEAESVNGYILNGKGGYFEVDIPLYSSRPFVHRGVMSGPSAAVQVLEWQPDRVVLQPGADFPGDVIEAKARRGNRILLLREEGAKWVWDEKKQTALDLDSFFETDKLRRFNYEGRGDFEPRNVFLPLAGIFYGDIKGFANRISRRPMPPDQMQLLLYASAPESFAMQGKGFHGEKGWVLYVIDLFRPTP
jgi:hypothetical protein